MYFYQLSLAYFRTRLYFCTAITDSFTSPQEIDSYRLLFVFRAVERSRTMDLSNARVLPNRMCENWEAGYGDHKRLQLLVR